MNAILSEIKKSVELSYKPEYDELRAKLDSMPECSRKKTSSISSTIMWLAGDYDRAISILKQAIEQIERGEG